LAGELERILYGLCALCGKHLTERFVRVRVLHSALIVNHQPYGAQAIVEIEVLKVLLFALVDVVLSQYLPVGVEIFVFQRAIGQIQVHQYYRQLACNVNYVFSFGGR
jgi:hypothetical protein